MMHRPVRPAALRHAQAGAASSHAPQLTKSCASGRALPGFTLVETIVAIAAVALVAVGLASIFDAVGKTVKGGKRISLLNQYAALVENQMRQDFDRMTRDGYLTIRHSFADRDKNARFDRTVDVIPLWPDDPSPRPRRIDEIIFFANGDYETARQPVHPDVRVKADTAMIYYGHGQHRRTDSSRYDPDANSQLVPDAYFEPALNDNNGDDFNSREARLGIEGDGNPNYHPIDWTLIRRATLLVKPQTAKSTPVPSPIRFGTTTLDPSLPAVSRRLRDTEYQIGLQPTARTIFRALNRYYPAILTTGQLPSPLDSFRAPTRAVLTSGLVDIASTDLKEIRSIIEGLGGSFIANGQSYPRSQQPGEIVMPSRWIPGENPSRVLSDFYLPWSWTDPYDVSNPLLPRDLDVMHIWMDQAFPGETMAGQALGSPTPAIREPRGVRMRYEPQPVNLIETLAGVVAAPPAPESIEQRIALSRVDQLMLASSGFIPNCSEFIVEWSYGLVDPIRNETIWYGPRARDASGNFASLPYPYNLYSNPANPTALPLTIDIPRLPYSSIRKPAASTLNPIPITDTSTFSFAQLNYTHVVTSRLIYGRFFEPQVDDLATTARFGYTDPTFKQDLFRLVNTNRLDPPGDGVKDYGVQYDNNRDGIIQNNNQEIIPGEPAATSIPWSWPRMIRITIILADPLDPGAETPFQFVFTVPDDPAIVIEN